MELRSQELRALNGLWIGEQLHYLEQLCLVSGLACGHQVRLFSYQPKQLRGVPSGVEVYDAAEVMPRERMLAYADSGSFALGSNFWRYEMLAKGLGYWIDLDVLLLKAFSADDEYVFGEEHEGGLNNAVLYAPANSEFVRDLCSLPQANRCPPWFGPKQHLKFFAKRILRGGVGLEDLPWGTFGPRMVTYAAKKHDILRLAAPPEVFYPISWHNIRALYDPRDPVRAMLTEKTLAIHLYNSQLRDLAAEAPPPGSYIFDVCTRLGILSKPRGPRVSNSVGTRGVVPITRRRGNASGTVAGAPAVARSAI